MKERESKPQKRSRDKSKVAAEEELAAIVPCVGSKISGVRFLIQDVVSAITSAKARRGSMRWGKAVSGELVYPKSRPDPDGWLFCGSMHLPDFLEFRPGKTRCDL